MTAAEWCVLRLIWDHGCLTKETLRKRSIFTESLVEDLIRGCERDGTIGEGATDLLYLTEKGFIAVKARPMFD
jgi:hypothetical protein